MIPTTHQSTLPRYTTREQALAAPGMIFTHFKGGVYRIVGFRHEDGKNIVQYEHLHPHPWSFFEREAVEFFEEVDKPEYNFAGPRFVAVKK